MAYPKWFIETEYLTAKLGQLQKAGEKDVNGKEFTSIYQVAEALKATGMDAFTHYNTYGSGEGLAPSVAFNPAEYCSFKLRQLQADDATKADWAGRTWQDVEYYITQKAGMSLGQHYSLYGAGEGVPMSNEFDTSVYLTAKLELLKAADKTWEGKTITELAKAMSDLGIDPYTHYMTYVGQEGEVSSSLDVSSQDPVHPGGETVFTLTKEVDKVVGTAGNDIIEGLFGGATVTYNGGDTIDGNGGKDTLNLIANGTVWSDPVTVKNIDTVNVQVVAQTGNNSAALDALLFDNVKTVQTKGSVGNLFVNNAKMGLSLGIENTKAGLFANFIDATGDADVVSVNLNKAGTKVGDTTNYSFVSVASNNTIEGVTLNSVTGTTNYVHVEGGTKNKTLTVTGAGVTDVVTSDTVTKVDAAASTGGVVLTLNGISNVEVLGSAAADTFNFGTTFNTADVVKGGAGKDKLTATLSASQNATVSEVESLELTFSGANGIYNASKTTGATEVSLKSVAATATAKITNAKAELATINVLTEKSSSPAFASDVNVAYVSGADAKATLNIGGAKANSVAAVSISNATEVIVNSVGKDATISGTQTYADAETLSFSSSEGAKLTATSSAVTADKVTTLNFTANKADLQVDNSSNSFDKLTTLNVLADSAKADVVAKVTPAANVAISIDEVNVKGTGAGSALDVTVEATTTTSGDVSISTVNYETAENSVSNSLKLVMDVAGDTTGDSIGALNITAAKGSTAKVLFDAASDTTIDLQGGTITGDGDVLFDLKGMAAATKTMDFSNLTRDDLKGTLTIDIDSTDAVTTAFTIKGTTGNDIIDITDGANASQKVKFAASWDQNGTDTIKGFQAGAVASDGDVLDFTAFASGRLIDANGSANTGTSVVSEFTKAGTAQQAIGNKIVVLDGGATAMTIDELVAQFATGKNFTLAAGAKAVIIEGDASGARSGNIYYVQNDGDASVVADEIKLVGQTSANFDVDTIVGENIA